MSRRLLETSSSLAGASASTLQKQRLALAEREYDDIARKVQAQTKLEANHADKSAQAY